VAPPAPAQIVPYGGYGYGWGPYASPSRSYVDRGVMAQQKGANQRMMLSQAYSQHQNTNQFLLGQSSRTPSPYLGIDASVEQARMQQAQRQSQQVAAMNRQRDVFSRMAPGVPIVPPSSVLQRAANQTRWPSLLTDPRFDEPRREIDKLLAREQSSEVRLTSGEYEEIVEAAAQMKDILRSVASRVNAAEYLAVEKFLDEMIQQYQSKAKPSQ